MIPFIKHKHVTLKLYGAAHIDPDTALPSNILDENDIKRLTGDTDFQVTGMNHEPTLYKIKKNEYQLIAGKAFYEYGLLAMKAANIKQTIQAYDLRLCKSLKYGLIVHTNHSRGTNNRKEDVDKGVYCPLCSAPQNVKPCEYSLVAGMDKPSHNGGEVEYYLQCFNYSNGHRCTLRIRVTKYMYDVFKDVYKRPTATWLIPIKGVACPCCNKVGTLLYMILDESPSKKRLFEVCIHNLRDNPDCAHHIGLIHPLLLPPSRTR